MAPVTTSPLAGQPAPKEMLVDPARLEREYYARKPDIGDPNQLVVFGTSGHRGSPLTGAFTDAHIAAITQAICDYRLHAAGGSHVQYAASPALRNTSRACSTLSAAGGWTSSSRYSSPSFFHLKRPIW